MDETFGQALRRLRSDRGLSQPQLGRLINYTGKYVSDLERGRRPPHRQLAAALDDALGGGGLLDGLAAREIRPRRRAVDMSIVDGPPEPGRPIDADDIATLHDTIDHLVTLDTAHGADDVYPLAMRTYRHADQRLAAGAYQPGAERDLQAAVAELGEVAGWLLYDADRQDDARRMSTEALLTARLAGDRDMELFVLSNLAMQSVYLHRSREALRIADEGLRLAGRSPRVEAVFHIRRARALAGLGDHTGAGDALAKARSRVADGFGHLDPEWTWWVSDAELAWHGGHAAASLSDRAGAVDLFRRAVDLRPAIQRRGRYNDLAHLFDALVTAGVWREAEQVAAELRALGGDVASTRTANLLAGAAGRVLRSPAAPSSLKDAVEDWAG